ncbi:MAG: proline iminopeptidase [Roseivirga sp.]|jgi:proline iminopeptidase
MKKLIFLLLLVISVFACDKADVPKENTSGLLQINGTDLFYKTIGHGEPLIIVHGGPVLDHSYFLPQLESLSENYQLIFYDQKVSGRSSIEVDSSTMTLDGFAEDIESIRNAFKLDKINLLGHSWGGLIAMTYAIKYNQHLDKLILSNSIAPNVSEWQMEGQVVGQRATENDFLERQSILTSGALQSEDPTDAIEKLLRISFRPQMADTTKLNELNLYVPKDYLQRSGLFSLLAPDLTQFDLYPDLDKISCPTLVLYGNREPSVYLHATVMAEAFPNGELKVIDGAGHFPFIEKPLEFNKTVLEFLNRK